MTQRIGQIASHLASNMAIKTDIHLYTAQTPNGIKISMLLEELGLEYKVSGAPTMYDTLSTKRTRIKASHQVTAIELGKNQQKVSFVNANEGPPGEKTELISG